ncbi:MAG TPA: polysaccharide deacetylase family protein [Saprospiraceae bacterium]|nr:polysaccharide deacetylase family protein [Saprospiraceae bacterium]
MLIIYSKKITPRLTYAASQIFDRILNIPYQLTDQLLNNIDSKTFVVYYDTEDINFANIIYSSGLCQQTCIENFIPIVSFHLDHPVYFQNPKKSCDYNIDIFSLVFYFLSRYEEYLPGQRDNHNRFSSAASISHVNNHLDFPIVDFWVRHFGEYLLSEFPTLHIPGPKFRFIPTFDIDHAWKYQNKGVLRNLGGFMKNLFNGSFNLLKERYAVLNNRPADPYFTFDDINKTHQGFELIYFILLGGYNSLDINISVDNKNFINLIKELAGQYSVGIHPSYESNKQPGLIKKEKDSLAAIVNKDTTKSRQHYLKLEFPNTYKNLIDAGMTADYTMGFADNIGFRAGTAHQFKWYNLADEVSTELIIWPFVAMDVAMRDYQNLSPEDGFLCLRKIKQAVQNTGGNFILIWHNSSFCMAEGWEEWVLAYKEFLNEE